MSVVVGIVGLSHLGIVTGLAIASKGFTLVGFDPDAALVQKMREGNFPIFEEGLDEIFQTTKERVSFTASAKDLSVCDVVYIAKDVPTTPQNISEVTPVRELISAILPSVKRGATVVVHSQVSPGFTRELLPTIERAECDISLYYQVETLVFGIAVQRALSPERYIIGCRNPAQDLPPHYKEVLTAFGCPLLPMRYESAELAKISINMFLVSSVITASTLAELCEHIGAEWREIVPALRLDKRIGPHAYLSAGLGLSGGNLERDLVSVQTLARQNGTDSAIVESWFSHAHYRRDWVLRVLSCEIFSKLNSPTLALWGLAYKADTHSTKNSPAIAFLDSVRRERVRVYDPQVPLGERARDSVVQAKSALDACKGADVLVVMTPWKEFLSQSPEEVVHALKGRDIIDPYGVLDFDQYVRRGCTVRRLGSPKVEE